MRSPISIPVLLGAAVLTTAPPALALDIAPDIGGMVKLQYGAFDRKPGMQQWRLDGEAHMVLNATDDTGIEYEARVQGIRAAKSRDNASYLSMKAAVAEQRDDIDDPQLDALLDEIELRVLVELAKLEYASSDTH